jgi:hypothetical protein
MARDWRRLAIAALAAAVLAPCAQLPSHAQATKQQATKAKGQGTQPAASKQPDEANADGKAAARKKKQDPVEAQRAIENAGKLIQSGKAEQAAQSLTATLAGGSLPPAIMAKALYLRGIAYRQTNKPAQAISDLTSAVWLKGGLPEEERADAIKQRVAAYADAGLTETGEPVAAAPAAKERQASAKGWGAKTSAEEGSSSNSSNNNNSSGPLGGNWFKDWFSGLQPSTSQNTSSQSTPPPTVTGSVQKAGKAPAPASAAGTGTRIGGGWSSNTDVQAEKTAAPAGRAPAPAGKLEGRYRVQLATVRTQQEAQALALKAKRELADKIAGREPEIDQAVFGNMGAFYRVRVGPFATVQETQAICAQAKGPGFDCLPITQ